MNIPLYTLLSYTGLFYATWVLFVFVMAVKERWPRLHWLVKAVAAPPALIGLVMDVVLNAASGVVLFLVMLLRGRIRPILLDPRNITLTSRLKECIREHPRTVCGRVSRFICDVFLDPFELGGHCS